MKQIFTLIILILLTNLTLKSQTITDADGNVYNTVAIGTQLWMKENLKTTKYSDGTSIPNITSSSAWGNLGSGAYCNYNNDSSNSITYGKLYNWYAATDLHNICPIGWSVPTDSDWNRLIIYLDSGADTSATSTQSLVVGGKLKETDTLHWNSPNTGATNETGFTALPGGYRMIVGSYDWIGYHGYWWSSTESAIDKAWYRSMVYNLKSISRDNHWKKDGFYIRCICDLPVSVNELKNYNSINIYPNPTMDLVVIDGLEKDNTIEIINIQGQILENKHTTNSKISIDISNLPVGIYTVKIKSNTGIIIKKLIKQ